MTEEEARRRLERAVKDAGGQKAFAAAHSLSPQFVNDVMRGRRGLSDTVCAAIGLQRRVTYSDIRSSV